MSLYRGSGSIRRIPRWEKRGGDSYSKNCHRPSISQCFYRDGAVISLGSYRYYASTGVDSHVPPYNDAQSYRDGHACPHRDRHPRAASATDADRPASNGDRDPAHAPTRTDRHSRAASATDAGATHGPAGPAAHGHACTTTNADTHADSRAACSLARRQLSRISHCVQYQTDPKHARHSHRQAHHQRAGRGRGDDGDDLELQDHLARLRRWPERR